MADFNRKKLQLLVMRRIDWDKVRRERNKEKPDYWEKWRDEWQPSETESFPAGAARPISISHQFASFNPKSAKEIKENLRAIGLRGSVLKEKISAILKGETTIGWA